MPDFCTCGAELPPDARFCHRCGKPQREEPLIDNVIVEPERTEAAPPADPVVTVASAAPPRVNFHNSTAVRIGLLMAGGASLLSGLPVIAFGPVGLAIWWLIAGFLSVFLYRRRTGYLLTVNNGLRMGWITGLLGATITCVVFTITVVPLIRKGGMVSLFEEQSHRMYGHDPNVQQALKILQTPSGLAMMVVFALLFFFLIITFLCTAGGALGAKLVGGVSGAGPKPAR